MSDVVYHERNLVLLAWLYEQHQTRAHYINWREDPNEDDAWVVVTTMLIEQTEEGHEERQAGWHIPRNILPEWIPHRDDAIQQVLDEEPYCNSEDEVFEVFPELAPYDGHTTEEKYDIVRQYAGFDRTEERDDR